MARRCHAGWPTDEAGGAEKAGAAADGWARGEWEKKKTVIQLQNSKTCTSRAPKIAKYLLEQDQTTKNTVQ
jgi:hypothetical protein